MYFLSVARTIFAVRHHTFFHGQMVSMVPPFESEKGLETVPNQRVSWKSNYVNSKAKSYQGHSFPLATLGTHALKPECPCDQSSYLENTMLENHIEINRDSQGLLAILVLGQNFLAEASQPRHWHTGFKLSQLIQSGLETSWSC